MSSAGCPDPRSCLILPARNFISFAKIRKGSAVALSLRAIRAVAPDSTLEATEIACVHVDCLLLSEEPCTDADKYCESDGERGWQLEHVDWNPGFVQDLFKSTEALGDLTFIASALLL